MNASPARVLKGRALVTGATGFIGSSVARCLIEAGINVRVLVRSTSSDRNIADLHLETVVGDLRDADSLYRAMTDVNYLFHVAADYRLWTRDPESMFETNVTGTRNVMKQLCDAEFRAWFTPAALLLSRCVPTEPQLTSQSRSRKDRLSVSTSEAKWWPNESSLL